jgi:amidase
MIVKTPTLDEIHTHATQFGLKLGDAALVSFQALNSGTLQSCQRLQALLEPALPVQYPRTGADRPACSEDPLNAWYYKRAIKGARKGPLSGRQIAIKDNVCVAASR